MTIVYKSTDEGDKTIGSSETILSIAVQESDENSPPVNNTVDLSVDTHLNNNTDDSDSPQANSELPTPSSATVVDDEMEIRFPESELDRLDDMVNRTRWIVPVLPGGELEVLLDASIALASKGLDEQCESCQKFYRDGLTQSFTKIMTDDAVSGWKYEIHRAIYRNCFKLVKLAYLKLHQDAYVIFDLLATVFNPECKFHSFNETRIREQAVDDEDLPHMESDFTYAHLGQEMRSGGLWLVDLISYFGKLGGFDRVQERFNHIDSLSLSTIAYLIKPFGFCHELLTPETIQKYFSGAIHDISNYLDNLSDSDLKKENKANDPKSDNIVFIIRSAQGLLRHLPEQDDNLANGKMNALNDLNRIINNTGYFHRQHFRDTDSTEFLSADQVATWINKNNVLAIALRENLHQPQYVEKLEKILRFMIKEKTLSTADLDLIWDAQVGKHEVIVSNVHDLLARLAWDFSAEQLDHVFQCFQRSYSTASSRRERERLLELARRLAEEDKEGVMAQKVLGLLWGLTNNDECPSEIMEQALVAHIKILDYNCSQDRESTKIEWINRIVREVKENVKWVLPALKQIRDICSLFTESSKAYSHTHYASRINPAVYRTQVVKQLQSEHEIIDVVCQNLADYMERANEMSKDCPDCAPSDICLDGRFSHHQQVTERLKFLRFVLKEGELKLKEAQAVQLWKSLAENAIFPSDREACFKWFSKWVAIDSDKELNKALKNFFENQILRFDPVLLTENGINCFDRFFRAVNVNEHYLSLTQGEYRMEEVNLHGVEYLWRTVLHANDEVAEHATRLLKETFTLLGNKLLSQQTSIHEDFIQQCDCRLKADLDTLRMIKDDDTVDGQQSSREHANRMMRVLTVLREYLAECDERFVGERRFLPLCRSWRGRNLCVTVRFTCQVRQNSDDIPITTHSNETMGCLRSRVLRQRVGSNGAANYRLHLFINSDLVEAAEDRRVVTHFGLRNLSLLSAQLVPLAGQSMTAGSHIPSSPESTSGSSMGGSPKLVCSGQGNGEQRTACDAGSQHNQGIGASDLATDEADNAGASGEISLPGVMMSRDRNHAPFLFQVAQLASCVDCPGLRDVALDVLNLMPPDQGIVQRLRHLITNPESTCRTWKDALFSRCEPPEIAYLLQTLYCLLMPALEASWCAPAEQSNISLMEKFITGGGVQALLEAFRENFIEDADTVTRRSACLWMLRILKIALCAIGCGCIKLMVSMDSNESSSLDPETMSAIEAAARVTESCVSVASADVFIQHIAKKVGEVLTAEQCFSNFPDLPVWIAIMKIVWSASTGSVLLMRDESLENIHKEAENVSDIGGTLQSEDICLAQEGLECMTLCLCLCPQAAEQLRAKKNKNWLSFIHDMVLACPSREIRLVARDQFWFMAGLCATDRNTTIYFVQLLFIFLTKDVKTKAHQSAEFFSLLEQLLGYVNRTQIALTNADVLMNNEIMWLKKSRADALESGEPEMVDQLLLEGHLKVLKELVHLQPPGRKYHVGSEKGGPGLIKELLEDFLFPASRPVLHLRLVVSSGAEHASDEREVNPVCVSPAAVSAAFELLVTLTMGCYQNMRVLASMLTDMYYSNHSMTLVEWDYLPPVGPRSSDGFVGLKNAGATCYMNSVLQQLFMIVPIRNAILTCDSSIIGGGESGPTSPALPPPHLEDELEKENDEFMESAISKDLRGDHNVAILRHVQVIFGHLAYSKQQFYIPKGFWKQFKLWGEHVNLREQHDALEFFNCLVDNIDEGLKKLGQSKVVERVMGGSFEDQKICKDCPHRYSREETFIILNVDIRNHHNLAESLEQYVKGDLLEGDNAYHCEECDKKVNTVKRMCIKKLPPILAIQLKRFDYDWDREVAVKFNDYFEFPRELDMDPYTARGLARIEGDTAAVVAADADREEGDPEPCSKFRLKGVVVHSGQASGGHYYSYILHKRDDGSYTWYKFDDNEVSECHMEDDEEMRNQCFGGEYMGEVYDHMIKRMAYRKQKRWWNAYILLYERFDFESDSAVAELQTSLSALSIKDSRLSPRLPNSIKKIVRQDNIHFMHTKAQFSPEYFHFMKRLAQCHAQEANHRIQTNDVTNEFETLVITLIELTARFLFTVGWRTKKALRGPASDWNDPFHHLLKISPSIRQSFAACFFCNSPTRISEYLLECQSSEVRGTYAKLFVSCAYLSLNDGPCPPRIVGSMYGKTSFDRNLSLSEHLMRAAINLLLRKEVCEYGRHLNQYFLMFHLYLSHGVAECQHLLRLNVPLEFIRLAIEDKAYPPMKYQIVEMNKLYMVVSELIMYYDVSRHCKTADNQTPRDPNPYQQKALMPMPQELVRFCYSVDSSGNQHAPKLVKKFVEDAAGLQEVSRLMKFLSWENFRFSAHLLYQLIWLIFYGYVSELRPYFDLFADIVMLPDSLQEQRVLCALTGAESFSVEGLFDVIHRLRGHHHKRVYQCLKMVTWLFENCQVAKMVLHHKENVRQAYSASIEWLNDELDKTFTKQNYYGQWSTPATTQSNDLSNGFYLERSQSAQMLLQKAAALLPELGDEDEEEDDEDEEEEDEVMATTDNRAHNIYEVDYSPTTMESGAHLLFSMEKEERLIGSEAGNEEETPDVGWCGLGGMAEEERTEGWRSTTDEAPPPEGNDSNNSNTNSGTGGKIYNNKLLI